MLLILVTTGRSGSTTLRNLINGCPKAHIHGECWGALIDLLIFYRKMKRTLHTSPDSDEWENNFDLRELKEHIHKMIESVWKQDEVFGFKDIRWYNRLDLLNELIEIYPNTKIWYHTRNPESQSKSSWWQSDVRSKELLTKMNEQIENCNPILSTTFDDLFNMDTMISKLSQIGLTLNPNHYNKVMERRTRSHVHDKSPYCPYCFVGNPQDCYCNIVPEFYSKRKK